MRIRSSLAACAATIILLAGCQPRPGPPREAVQDIARTLFERAARGESVPVNIPFTGQGPHTPRLTDTEVLPLRPAYVEGREVYNFNVRLTYLNRIAQLEHAEFVVRLQQEDGAWQTSFPGVTKPQ
jgi:hypothetical protein